MIVQIRSHPTILHMFKNTRSTGVLGKGLERDGRDRRLRFAVRRKGYGVRIIVGAKTKRL